MNSLAASLLLLAVAFPAAAAENGSVRGTVLNLSGLRPQACQTEVVLRVFVDGQLALFRETKSDAQGRFRFDHLPVGAELQVLRRRQLGRRSLSRAKTATVRQTCRRPPPRSRSTTRSPSRVRCGWPASARRSPSSRGCCG